MTRSQPRLRAWAAGVVVLAAVSVGCGSGDQAPSDFCKAVDSLTSAVEQITQTPLTKASVESLKTSIATLETAVTNVVDAAESEFSSEVDAVKSAARGLADSIAAAAAQPNADTVFAARTAMSSFTTAVSDLGKAVSESC